MCNGDCWMRLVCVTIMHFMCVFFIWQKIPICVDLKKNLHEFTLVFIYKFCFILRNHLSYAPKSIVFYPFNNNFQRTFDKFCWILMSGENRFPSFLLPQRSQSVQREPRKTHTSKLNGMHWLVIMKNNKTIVFMRYCCCRQQ